MACLAVVAGDQLTHPASRHSRLRAEEVEEGERQGAGAKDAEVEGFGGKEEVKRVYQISHNDGYIPTSDGFMFRFLAA